MIPTPGEKKPILPGRAAAIGAPSNRLFGGALVSGLTVLALGIHGYHPYSEDGGLYIAGVKRLLRPELYTASAPFVDAHLRYSFFAPMVAALVRLSHLSLPVVLLLLYLTSIWSTLFAAWLIVTHCFTNRAARTGAVVLLALWMSIPIAGTSLLLVDPYITARSLSLPCTLFALAQTLTFMRSSTTSKRLWACLLASISLLLAAAMHPLMAAYGLGAVLLLASLLSQKRAVRRWMTVSLCLLALMAAAILQHAAPAEPAAYLPIALSRYYWFLSRWHWYEIAGVVAPLVILSFSAVRSRTALQPLARMAVLAGSSSLVVALLFAHANAPTHLVARLQPLRLFQLVYIVMILALGGLLGEHVLKRFLWRWLTLIMVFGGIFFAVQRATYPASAHLEWPGIAPINQWEQAFVWISQNTPVNALFALDARYITAHREDAQCFRAMAERSSLPDYSKDGGEASITPSLTAAWAAGQQAQTGLSTHSDAERFAALRPLNVTWVVLQWEAQTAFDCPFSNAAVQVCRLP